MTNHLPLRKSLSFRLRLDPLTIFLPILPFYLPQDIQQAKEELRKKGIECD